jgi:hypothetical protein
MATASDDLSFKVWDFDDWKGRLPGSRDRVVTHSGNVEPLLGVRTRAYVPDLDWSPDGSALAVAGARDAVILYRADISPNEPVDRAAEAKLLLDDFLSPSRWVCRARKDLETDPKVRDNHLIKVIKENMLPLLEDDPIALAEEVWESVCLPGESASDQRRFRDAQELLLHALELRPDHQVLTAEGAVLFRLAQYPQAADFLDKAEKKMAKARVAEEGRERRRLRAFRAMTWHKQGEGGRAKEELQYLEK